MNWTWRRSGRLYKLFYEQNKDLIGMDRSALPPTAQQRFDALANTVPDTRFTGWEIVNELEELEQRLTTLAAASNTLLNRLQTHLQTMPFHQILRAVR